MNSKLKILSLILAILMVSCAQKPGAKKFKNAPTEFGPTTQDVTLDRSLISSKSVGDLILLPAGAHYLRNSEEIFEFAGTLLDLASVETEAQKKQSLINLSEKVRSAYYSNSKNYTTFDAKTSTYLELALGLTYEESLKDMVHEKLDVQKNNLGRALEGLDLKLIPQASDSIDLGATIWQFENFLAQIPAKLKKEGVESKVVSAIDKVLRSEYLPLLSRAKTQLQSLNIRGSAFANINKIEKTIKGFSLLPQSFIRPLLSKLLPAKKLSIRITSPTNADELVDVLFDLWTNPLVNHEDFKAQNKPLYDFFSGMSQEQMAWLKDYNLKIIKKIVDRKNNAWYVNAWNTAVDTLAPNADKFKRAWELGTRDPYVLTGSLWYLKSEINSIGIDNIIHGLEEAINRTVLRQFDEALRESSALIVSTVVSKIAQNVGDSFLGIKHNLKSILRDEGQVELAKRIYVNKSKFVAVEDSRAALLMNKQNKLMTETHSEPGMTVPVGSVLTSAKTLGLALSLEAKRLFRDDNNANVSKATSSYYEQIFRSVNKMMAIGGFKYMEKERPRFSGLYRKIKGNDVPHDMDMFNYDLESSYFAVPDRLVVSKDFTINQSETLGLGHLSTVAGNAELARGAAHMMYYFRDWVKNGYDESMAREEYQGVNIFPKEAFYALSIGVGSVPLRNLTREGLTGYTLSGQIREATSFGGKQDNTIEECPVPDAKDPVVAAALTNVSPGGVSDIVKSADIARFILAADIFIEATDDVELTKAGPFQKEENGIRTTVKAVRCGQKSLKSLMMGLANFLVSKMQSSDGGFAHQYSLKQGSVVPNISLDREGKDSSLVNRYLEDQLLVMLALKKVFIRWKGQAYANLAVDAYHFMNRNLFNTKLGFYKSSEKSKTGNKADVRLMSMTLKALHELRAIVPTSDQDQLEFLIGVWSSRMQDFSQTIAP